MRKFEQYRIKDNVTPLNGSTFGHIFGDIDARIDGLESIVITWKQAVAEVQNFGIKRINGMLEPVLTAANNSLAGIQTELATLASRRTEFEDWWSGQGNDIAALQLKATALEYDLDQIANGGWLSLSFEPFFVSAHQFSITGDVAGHFPEDRMVRAQLGTGYVYALVLGAVYTEAQDQTLVTLKAGVLDNTISQVNLGILRPGEESALPGDVARVDQLASRQPGFMTVWADYKNSSTTTISAGKIVINSSLYSVPADIDHTINPTGDSWYWVMAHAPNSGSEITPSEITSTSIAPTYDGSKEGWYSADGARRCIGFVLSVGGALMPSRLINGWFSLDRPTEMYSTASWPSSETAFTIGPPFRATVNVTVRLHQTGANAQRNYIFLENGDSLGSVYGEGIGIYFTGSSLTDNYFYASVIRSTNSSGQLKTKSSLAQEGSIWLLGICLPGGFGK
jgi:hypothetical protein